MLQKTGLVAEVHSFGFALGDDTVTIEYRLAGDGDVQDWTIKDWDYTAMDRLPTAIHEAIDSAVFAHCAVYGGSNVA